MARYAAEQSEGAFFVDVLKIALGVFIGSLMAAFVYTKYMAWEMERALGPVNATLNREAKRMSEETSRMFQQSERERQQREAAAQIERDARIELAQQKRQQQQAEADRDAKRQAAWERYYQPSASCVADSSTMACANAFMAAKKRFLEQYRD